MSSDEHSAASLSGEGREGNAELLAENGPTEFVVAVQDQVGRYLDANLR